MAKQTIDIGTAPNDGTGDTLRISFGKINDNFTETYEGLATYISVTDLKALVAASTDFVDFQTRISSL
jgi:hypothetical protein